MSTLVDYITVKGFRSIASVENLRLNALNVLVGANGSGKSNFIEFFAFLRSIRNGHLQDYVANAGGAERLLHFSSKETSSIEVKVSFLEERNGYELRLDSNEEDTLYPFSEDVWFWDKAKYPRPYTSGLARRSRGLEAGISSPDLTGTADWVRLWLGSWRRYHFHDTSSSSSMRKSSSLEDNSFFRQNGSNLAAFLFFLKEKHRTSYNLIRKTVQRVAPFFDDFDLNPSRLNKDSIRLEWKHKGSDAFFDASSLSDGTLRFIALATLALQPEDFLPSLILLDEPELGLHPYAIELLGSLIKRVSQSTQVIIATQSALLLDSFSPEDVLVANRVGRSTDISRLDADRLKAWLDDYSLGQLWEKNEFAGRPAAE